MPTDASDARWARVHRTSRVMRIVALVSVPVAPLAQAAWVVHIAAGGPAGDAVTSIAPLESGVAPRVRDYFARRHPVVDALLPEGRGGTRFYEHLDGAAGAAFVDRAAIGLSAASDFGAFPESIELHERAHLAHAFLPDAVAALMARLPPAHADEYAATNAGEHFGEMAAQAWRLVGPPGEFCVSRTPEMLAEVEARVPGTAGFVVRFIRRGGFTDPAILEAAERLSAPYRAELDAIWRAIDLRRKPGGGYAPWRHETIRGYLESRVALAHGSERWLDRAFVVLLQPSLLIARLPGVFGR